MQRSLNPKKLQIILIGVLVTANFVFAQKKHPEFYFYRPEIDYGSEAISNPFTIFLNGGFDILRNGSHQNNGETNDIFKLDYRTGFSNVWDNITSPAYHISRYGWSRFLSEEVVPTSLNRNKAQWVPNYGHHILGSGMLWVRMAEWYQFHKYPHPYFLSFLTTTAYQFLNEALENNHSTITNVDPIADLLIFNPLGFIVFHFEAVRRFFSQTVRMYDWSLQPVYNPFNRHLENAGLQFTFNYDLNDRYALFFYYGIYGMGGITYSLKNNRHISLAVGTVVNRLNEHVIRHSRIITPTTDGAIGFFYDRHHSLMTSILITGPRRYNLRMNLYPGFVHWKWFRPGLFLAFGQWDGFKAGITMYSLPIGLGGQL